MKRLILAALMVIWATGAYADPIEAFSSHAQFTAFDPTLLGGTSVTADVAGYHSPGDGGAATYDWVPGSSASPDGVFTLQAGPAPNAGRWIMRIPGDGVHPEVAGAYCDGIHDDSTAMTDLFVYLQNNVGNGTVTVNQGKWCVISGGDLWVFRHGRLTGSGNPMTTTGGIPAVFTGGILLDPTKTIQLGDGATISHLIIMRNGLPQKPANMEAEIAAVNQWSTDGSVGVTAAGDDVFLEDDMIVGFGSCFYSNGYARTRARDVYWDCANGFEITASYDAIRLDNLQANNIWAFNLSNRYGIWAAAVQNAGFGYQPGDLLTVQGGTCATQPVLQVGALAGWGIATATVSDSGDCTVEPANPVSVAGGWGGNATFDLSWQDSGYRPGIGYNFHDRVDGGMASKLQAIGLQTGMVLNNVFGMNIDKPAHEGDLANISHQPIGILTQNCAAFDTIVEPYVQGDWRQLDFEHADANHGGSCGLAGNKSAFVAVIGGNAGSPLTGTDSILHMGPYSQGVVDGLMLDGAGATASVVVAANSGIWTLSNLILGINVTYPWISIDPTSVGQVFVSAGSAFANSGTNLNLTGSASALSTGATSGMILVPGTSGAPTSAPVGASAGSIPMTVDTTDGKVCFYYRSAWKCTTLN